MSHSSLVYSCVALKVDLCHNHITLIYGTCAILDKFIDYLHHHTSRKSIGLSATVIPVTN